ncbi:hypothetical protein AUEXF2481DRAFT_8427 [Aureobasidium subglaciale EXF-2481]|uniref:Uncharacterized protein n=1 Tax=Aureobasidium subglaciale (strain EXF-2481) TaxID=1043005 RepID=A0A074Y185_AURSE|nr:uncharacterized protein AUEXF2481DRAFT_8427 [Aureobasidium subglaciale EXF-2481]KAI5200366.1 hypothetical protein E4T38_06543 [Aureobasidium subglaciale]KAI5218988.1 hypothetical protein E4T40_06662 [Aureobasidium subglaciale]KAI5222716.1 hypothetical protein E4T41_06483 [Aureobasidium subglaciale]KAI5260265.1 hypothetical protein E4T46_06195 [Aureobasidium subglaciale]KEQ91558.1 hypothetical protein AUEXF2481DRAFT_8427 [Aureobasidium subglaciale EXF-2481]
MNGTNQPSTPPPRQRVLPPRCIHPNSASPPPDPPPYTSNDSNSNNDPFVGPGGLESVNHLIVSARLPLLTATIAPMREEVELLRLLAAQNIDSRIREVIEGVAARIVFQLNRLESEAERLKADIFGPMPEARDDYYRD